MIWRIISCREGGKMKHVYKYTRERFMIKTRMLHNAEWFGAIIEILGEYHDLHNKIFTADSLMNTSEGVIKA